MYKPKEKIFMTKKVVWKNTIKSGNSNYIEYAQNIHVEDNGEIISSILKEIDIEGDFVYITVDVEFTRTFKFYGDFLVSNFGFPSIFFYLCVVRS